MDKITILVVDDHLLVRESWSFVLNGDERFTVVGEAGNPESAMKIVKEMKPDIILMDINMSPVNGFEGTRMVLSSFPASKIIGISMHAMPAYAQRMLRLGAMGYVTKNSSRDELFTAILRVNDGKKYICEEVKDILIFQDGSDANLNILSRRELEITGLIKNGLSSREIGLELHISVKTVEVHRYHILKKLHMKNTAALVNYVNGHAL